MSNVIIALDFPTMEVVESFLDKFSGETLFVKIGMELYYQTGPEIVRAVKSRGHKIFLDLKLHDIPNTVERTMRGLSALGVDMTNVHAAGGIEMMKAAKRGLGEGPQLIAVTQLTSTTEEAMHHEQLIDASLNESVINYAKITQEAGLEGVVCSPLEAGMIRDNTSDVFLRVTPGVRLASAKADDQKRITTPKRAKEIGSTHIVVGRPITASDDPVRAYHDIVREWEEA
ncbi:orotidine-5'-phosphate decarboxylase [Erysipelothrix sp. HDW6C]|uniref:orotidine-5'-phosphate decarboxylase n=1 Tax=Erysipelothrix sp. HDW6C TaxID=2714930 RepID=UPI00140D5B79|nr:orotidine-5'-phosphate decarboxylase [Erysipelothrix sp. HDW6C]QIK69126.1 orotidine-5'-phosphate decarboxylase [Erysipelothrix sp. HDW6C]